MKTLFYTCSDVPTSLQLIHTVRKLFYDHSVEFRVANVFGSGYPLHVQLELDGDTQDVDKCVEAALAQEVRGIKPFSIEEPSNLGASDSQFASTLREWVAEEQI